MELSAQVLDAFERLGISPDTPQDVARSTYKKLALSHHPDRNHGDPTATQRFQLIGTAWQTCQRYYENPSWGYVQDPAATSRGRSHEPYDGPRYSAEDDIPLDEEEAEMFFRFMFEEMIHNRFSYARGRHYRQQRSGAYGGGMHAFSGGFAESQKRQEENAEKLRNENEAYKQRVRELDAEIAAEQSERERIARDQNISQERHISAQLRAFQKGKAGDAAGMRDVIQEFNLDVNAPEKLKSKLQHRQKQGEEVKFETMLHVAAASCDPDTVLFLMRRGANSAALNSSSLTPFQLAILHSNTAVVRSFLERHHANPKAEGYHPSKAARDGRTPLQLALACDKPDISLVSLLLKEATVHDVSRCWERAEMMVRSAKEGSMGRDGVKWQEIRDVLLTKKGFSPSSEDSTWGMSKNEIKVREAEEKARRRAEDEARAAENLRKKRERAEMREREETRRKQAEEERRKQDEEERRKQEEEERRERENERRQEAEKLRKAQERRRKEIDAEKARKRKEMEEMEVRRLAEVERAQELIRRKEAQAERQRQVEHESRRRAEIARLEVEAETERQQQRSMAEARRNQKAAAAARRIEREERMRAEQEQRSRDEAERRREAEREERFRTEQQQRARVTWEMQEAAVKRTRREADIELERVRKDAEEKRAASAKLMEEAKMRRRAEQSARDKARNQRIREERERDRVKAFAFSESQTNGTLSASRRASYEPRRHLSSHSPPAYPTPSPSFSHSPPSAPPPIQVHTRQKTPVALSRIDSHFAPPSPPMAVDIQSRAIPDDLFRYEPPAPVTSNSVSSVSALPERGAELHPNPGRGRRGGWRGGGRGRGREHGIDARGLVTGGWGRGRGGRSALEAEVAQKDFELQRLRAQLAAAEGRRS